MEQTKVRGYSDKQLLDRVKSLDNFKEVPKDYWILGIRSNEDTPNIFDDKFYLFKGEKFILVTTGTTNPGTPSLLGGWKKTNKVGSFILKADYWHYNIWMYGLHKDKMPALKQLGNVAIGYRDNDNDDKSEEIGGEVNGWFGINFHFNSYDIIENKGWKKAWNKVKNIYSWVIGPWSEGCQVANQSEHYRKIIDLTKDQRRVSYCLLNEFDV